MQDTMRAHSAGWCFGVAVTSTLYTGGGGGAPY